MKVDLLQRFIFDNAAIRGEWVNLQESWQSILRRRDYPLAIRNALGEMLGATSLLLSTVKIKGRMVLQIRSEGPVKLMMVECTSDHTVRAIAQYDGDITDEMGISDLCENGTLAITIEVDGAKQPYQGIVSVQGQTIADTLEVYFTQSEQLPTKIWLCANEHDVAGFFLQQLPSEEGDKEQAAEDWSRISHLANTLTEEELLTLEPETLLHRLFHEESVRLFDPIHLSFACTCSRERVADSLRLIGREEVQEIVEAEDVIEATCDFCNEVYTFDKVDVAELFSDGSFPEGDPTVLH